MATQINISSKYQDIISKVVLTRQPSERPAVYQLRPKKEKFGTLTRVTVGEKNPDKTNKTILLVGETGAGKSTLINALFNYSMGVKFEEEVWFQIVEEEERRNQAETQTTDVIVYQIFGFEDKTLPYSLTIIDTPGYGDTRGTEHDVIVSQRLFDLFRSEDGVKELYAVGLVMNAGVNRLSDRLMYVFDSMMSLFGKDMEENFVALITHSDGVTPENALNALKTLQIRCAKDEDGEVHFMFNNRQNKQRTQKNIFGLEQAWKVTDAVMGQFESFLATAPSKKVKTTVEVMNTRIRLTACIQNLQEKIILMELKQKEIEQIQEALKKHEEEMKKNEEFTVEVDEVYKQKEPIDGGMWGVTFFEAAVCCTVCKENCHYPGCTMAWKPEHCEVMKGGRCTICNGKCPASDHVKEKWRYVTKTRKVTRTEDEIKQKYEENKSAATSMSTLLGCLECEKKTLEDQKSKLLDESYQHIDQLEQIALNVNSVSTYVHLDFLIEKMKGRGDTEKVQKLEEMKKRDNKRIILVLYYIYGKLTGWRNALKEMFSI